MPKLYKYVYICQSYSGKSVGSAASGLTKVGTGRKLQFSDSCKFPTEEIIGAQNFNYTPNLPQNGFSAPI